MQEILLKIRYFERRLSKSLKKANFIFFLSKPVPFCGQDYEKQKGHGNSDQSFFRLQNKFEKIPLLVMYYLAKIDVIKSSFWVIPKSVSAYICKSMLNHDIIN